VTNLKAKDFQRRDLNNIVAILQRSIKRTIILFYIDTSKSQNPSQYSKKEARNNNEID